MEKKTGTGFFDKKKIKKKHRDGGLHMLSLPTIGSNEVFSLGIPEPKKMASNILDGLEAASCEGGFAYHEIWGESRKIHRGRCPLLNYHCLHCFSSWFEPLWQNIQVDTQNPKTPSFHLKNSTISKIFPQKPPNLLIYWSFTPQK